MADIVRTMAAVNAAKNARKDDDEDFDAGAAKMLLRDDVIQRRLEQTDELIKKRFNRAYKKNQIAGAHGDKKRAIQFMRQEIDRRLETTINYRNLLSFMFFFLVFLAALFEQRDTAIAFSIENPMIAKVFTSISKSGGVSDLASFMKWFKTIVTTTWKKPVCGNGICEAPEEFAGFGRFGCARDCGTVSNLQPFVFEASGVPSLQTEGFAGEVSYTYNIVVESLSEDWFETDQSITASNARTIVQLPAGQYTIKLFQDVRLEDEFSAASSYFSDRSVTGADPILETEDDGISYNAQNQVSLVASARLSVLDDATLCQSLVGSSNCTVSNNDALKLAFQYGADVFVAKASKPGERPSSPLVDITSCKPTDAEWSQIFAGTFSPNSVPQSNLLRRSLPNSIVSGANVDPLNGPPSPSPAPSTYQLGTILQAMGPCKSEQSFTISGDAPVTTSNVSVIRPITPFNILIGGLVVRQKRLKAEVCTRQHIAPADSCVIEQEKNLTAFGLDPVFLPTSTMYDKILVAAAAAAGTQQQGRSVGSSTTVIPYGFFPQSEDDDEVRVYFDNDLTEEQALEFVKYMEEGFFIDNATASVDVEFVTFNTQLDMFSHMKVSFGWDKGGEVTSGFSLQTIDLSPYEARDRGRIGLEVIVVAMLAISIISECIEIIKTGWSYFGNAWNIVDWASIAMLIASVVMWFSFFTSAENFSVPESFDLIKNLKADTYIIEPTEVAKTKVLLDMLNEIDGFASFIKTYSTVNGINIILLILRLLKLMDFQPRMGLVTRTLGAAFTDLGHFLLLFSLVFLGYACTGVLLFGHQMQKFSTIGESIVECMMMLLALDAPYNDMITASDSFTTAIFFWSFVLFGIFILLNIFLAILVDSYAEVKSNSGNARTIPDELGDVLAHSMRNIMRKIGIGSNTFVPDSQIGKSLDKFIASSAHPEVTSETQSQETAPEGQIENDSDTELYIDLDEGQKLKKADLAQVFQFHKLRKSEIVKSKQVAPTADASSQPPGEKVEEGQEKGETEIQTESVVDVEGNQPDDATLHLAERTIERFQYLLNPEDDDTELLRHLKAENMQRQLAMYATQNEMDRNLKSIMQTVAELSDKVEKLSSK